jgi:hypothetical protein
LFYFIKTYIRKKNKLFILASLVLENFRMIELHFTKMEKKLINLAIATAIYEESRNYLDTYLPFIIKSFENSPEFGLVDLKHSLLNSTGIDLPIHSLKNILSRNEKTVFSLLKKNKGDWKIAISEKGKNQLLKIIINEKKVESKLNSFYEQFILFSKDKLGAEIKINEVGQEIYNFINSNLLAISIDKNEFRGRKNNEVSGFEKAFIAFLIYIKEIGGTDLDTFDDIWKGTVIWNELLADEAPIKEKQFEKPLTIYVDTNFIISVLGFHNQIINQAAIELLNLISYFPNITLKVLDITLNELCGLLDYYKANRDSFSELEVDTVFYYLKKLGLSLADVEKLKSELTDTLSKKFKIYTEEVTPHFEKDLIRYSDIYNQLIKVREERNKKLNPNDKKSEFAIDKSSHHDASAITHVLKQKDRYAREFEKCKAIFLTSSYRLYRDYFSVGRNYEGFSSIILDATLTNILYLKNPKTNKGISIDIVIKVHSNYLIIDETIWNYYLKIIKILRERKEITPEDHARLISNNQITSDFLRSAEIEKINQNEVKDILNKIKKEEKEKIEEIGILKSQKGSLETRLKAIEEKSTKRIKELEGKFTSLIFQQEFEKYNDKKTKYCDNKFSIDVRIIRKKLIKFILLLLGIALLTLWSSFLLQNFIEAHFPDVTNGSMNNISNCLFSIIGILIELITFFYAKDDILAGLDSFFQKQKLKDLKYKEYIIEFEKENPPPFK